MNAGLAGRCWSSVFAVAVAACAGAPTETQVAPPASPSAAPAASVVAAPSPPASSAAASAPITAPVVRPPPVGELKIDRTVALGLWPENVVVIGDDAWVTESGVRRVTKVSLTTDAPPKHVQVGRLPVELALAPNGKLYTVAQTDKQVWEIDPATTKARVFATLPDCPSDAALGDGALWVLLWQKCSSASSSVVRVSLSDKKQTLTDGTGESAWSIAHGHGRAWIALGDSSVTVLGDPSGGMKKVTAPKRSNTSRKITSGPRGIYLTDVDDVVRIDPATALRTHDARLDQRVLTMFADATRVVAATRRGTIWVLDPETLATELELRSPVTGADPRALAAYGDKFVLIDHGPDREHARLFVLSVVPPSR